ncbi:hypothetical protein CHARACLAT_019619 [Characodon lateralis]|uniref:Uncharacterized protein n=1 Tax=Characodon lateralis TaxID=208331 RepID=A0ABU7E603_9TELE|nr:hypothetical protein [Characodon lateralis]
MDLHRSGSVSLKVQRNLWCDPAVDGEQHLNYANKDPGKTLKPRMHSFDLLSGQPQESQLESPDIIVQTLACILVCSLSRSRHRLMGETKSPGSRMPSKRPDV